MWLKHQKWCEASGTGCSPIQYIQAQPMWHLVSHLFSERSLLSFLVLFHLLESCCLFLRGTEFVFSFYWFRSDRISSFVHRLCNLTKWSWLKFWWQNYGLLNLASITLIDSVLPTVSLLFNAVLPHHNVMMFNPHIKIAQFFYLLFHVLLDITGKPFHHKNLNQAFLLWAYTTTDKQGDRLVAYF